MLWKDQRCNQLSRAYDENRRAPNTCTSFTKDRRASHGNQHESDPESGEDQPTNQPFNGQVGDPWRVGLQADVHPVDGDGDEGRDEDAGVEGDDGVTKVISVFLRSGSHHLLVTALKIHL